MKKFLAVATLMTALASPAAAQMHGNGPVEVPLRVEQGRLLVPVEAPDGTVFEFILSTGTPPTVLSASTAARLGDETGLTIGGLPLATDDIVTVPDEQLTVDGMVFAGMVGPDSFNDFDVLIDVPGERFVLKPFGRSVEWEDMKLSDPIRLQVYHGTVLALEVALNGKTYQAQLDLGLSTVVVNTPVGEAMHLEAEGVTTLALGRTTLSDLSTRVRDLDVFGRWDPEGNGFVIVGAPIAYDCAISISWVHREMRTCVQ